MICISFWLTVNVLYCVNCVMLIFVTSVVSLVGIGTFLHKMGGNVVYSGGGVNFRLFSIGLGVLFAGFCLFFPGIST